MLSVDAFRVAAALGLGVGPGRLRSPDLTRPFHGVRMPGSASSRAGAYLPLLRRGDRFSHTTAAELWPLPLPPPRSVDDLHVTATLPRNRPRRPGVVGHVTDRDAVVRRHGMPLSEPAALFVELATMLGEEDLVAVGDALVLDPEVLDPLDIRPWIPSDELRAACAASRSPGCRRARRAVAQVRQGAESRPETLLRLLLIRSGLPEPEVNPVIRDARGRRIGRFDLVYRSAGVLVEYDGDQHRTSRVQYERDMTRLDRAIADGWRVIRIRSRGLFVVPQQTVDRVRAALPG